jgi:pimeloyl-ACP methyl ester carboxylesterase
MNFPSTTPGVFRRAVRRLAAISALALTVSGLGASGANAANGQLLLVHGHGEATKGKDCNGDIWENALRYYQDAGGRERSSLTTIGYYPGDKGRCDAMVGDGKASNARPIQDIARDLAIYIDREYTSQGRPVDVIAHSMGGLITRVALLGSAQGWDGFPAKQLNVDNVVTLSTPHQGVANPGASNDRQWQQMAPGSGFIDRLQENDSGLGDSWAEGTDWTLVGSHEDTTVSHDSGIDKGNSADQKLGYQDDSGDSGEVSHTGVRELYGANRYDLAYWHASGDHPPHHTENGWSPLKAAFQAATKVGDGLPK